MEIRILEYSKGAKKARGLTVIIDVFRAFTVGCYVMNNGAEEIIAVGEVVTALLLRRQNPEYLLMGERNERKVKGFDYGNSPSHIERIDFTGKTVVQTTSAGTQGLILATGAEEIITGSLVNADAIATYIKERNPSLVSLVAMGYSGKTPAAEDLICAEYIRAKLLDLERKPDEMIRSLKSGSGKRFFKPENFAHSPPNDFYLCTRIGIFNFVLRAEKILMDSVILRKYVV
jgi:2-phosphosulfolactate phosphatase